MKNKIMKKTLVTTILSFLILMLPCVSNVHSETVFENGSTGNRYSVIVGIDDYEKNGMDLHRPAEIAKCIYESLSSKPGWYEENIKLLTDKKATKQGIIDALDWLESVSTDEDVVVFTFAGHGSIVPDDNGDERFDQVIVPQDAGDDYDDFISDDELNQELSEVKAKGMYIVIDSCFSGGFNDLGEKDTSEYNIFKKYNDFNFNFTSTLSKSENRVVFMSSLPSTATYNIKTPKDGNIGVTDGIPRAIENGETTAEGISEYTKNWWLNHPTIIITMIKDILFYLILLSPAQIIFYLLHGHFYAALPVPHMIDNYPGELQII